MTTQRLQSIWPSFSGLSPNDAADYVANLRTDRKTRKMNKATLKANRKRLDSIWKKIEALDTYNLAQLRTYLSKAGE